MKSDNSTRQKILCGLRQLHACETSIKEHTTELESMILEEDDSIIRSRLEGMKTALKHARIELISARYEGSKIISPHRLS